MATIKQIKILEAFRISKGKKLTAEEIKKERSINSNNFLYKALNQLIKEKVIETEQVGKSKLYNLNFNNEIVYSYFSLLAYEGVPKTAISSLEHLREEIEKYTLFYSLVVFGSYAVGKQTNKSDLDVAIFLPDKKQEGNIKIAENTSKNKSLIPLHIETITYDDMFEMLVNKSENVGKEIARKHKAIQNINIFYKIIKKAREHGFNY